MKAGGRVITLTSDSEEVRRRCGTRRPRHRHRGRESVSVSLSAGEEIGPDPDSRSRPRCRLPIPTPMPTPDPDPDPDPDSRLPILTPMPSKGEARGKGDRIEQSVPESEDFRNYKGLRGRLIGCSLHGRVPA
jgi:hypothetical protein